MKFRPHISTVFRFLWPVFLGSGLPLLARLLERIFKRDFETFIVLCFLGVGIFLLFCIAQIRSFELELAEKEIIIRKGVFVKKEAVLPHSKISAVHFRRSFADIILGTALFSVRSQADPRRRTEFAIKLKKRDAGRLYRKILEVSGIKDP